jgi:hypothetical protein
MLQLAVDSALEDWSVNLGRLAPVADFVAEVIKLRYPGLDVPLHSRWRHFVLEGVDLWAGIAHDAHGREAHERAARWKTPGAAARAAFDLVITSVLLDAGAGSEWRFRDRDTGLVVARSEGLALASLRWFQSGGLSGDPRDPYRADAAVLRRIDERSIEHAFQAGHDNALAGLPGRAALLNRLGAVAEARRDLFALHDSPRPGGLFDALHLRAVDGRISAAAVLEILLDALGPIWEGRPHLAGVPLGDCWPHPALKGERPEDGFAPLHKLSQWLTYSLIEPLESAGIAVTDMQDLTGLAEYRNGGLFIDMGVLAPREQSAMSGTHAVASPFVVGWRALTVALLDELAPLVGARLGLTSEQFPLARMLEGGTWAAGRITAGRMRPGGGPPFHISSDGTVF